MYNFTTQFRNDVDRVAEELGLINTTSDRQVKNGTIELTDPVVSWQNHKVTYTLHENGYIRRRLHLGGSKHICGFTHANGYSQSYLLNHRPAAKNQYGFKRYKPATLAGPIEQLGILTNRVLKYRDYAITSNS